ncbi:hypothetical protein U1Q18_029813 [Sarracenia purpurea var. burkii]
MVVGSRRSEVAVSARDFKFYSPRHKYRRVAPNSVPSIPSLPTFPGSDNSSPMATGQGYSSVNEDFAQTILKVVSSSQTLGEEGF